MNILFIKCNITESKILLNYANELFHRCAISFKNKVKIISFVITTKSQISDAIE